MTPEFHPEALLEEEIVVNKLDAALRQLESSITMFIFDWDVISQHTLTSAAHGILYDLARQRGIGGSIKDSELVTPEKRREFITAINLPQNFFKHADRDSDTRLAFRYNLSHFYLYDAVRLLVLLGGELTPKIKVFLGWFQLRYPDLLCYKPAEENLKKVRESSTDPEYFKAIGRKLIRDLEGETRSF